MERRVLLRLGSGLVFVISTSFTAYISLQAAARSSQLEATQWNLIFWVLFLFMSLYIGGAEATMRRGRVLFYFLLAPSLVFWASKVLELFLYLLLLGSLLLGLQLMWMGSPFVEEGVAALRFWSVMSLGALGFACVLTTLSLLVARAEASGFLFAVLGLPMLVPLSVFCIRAAQDCMPVVVSSGDATGIWALLGFVLWLFSIMVVVFPYIWKN